MEISFETTKDAKRQRYVLLTGGYRLVTEFPIGHMQFDAYGDMEA